MTTTGTICERDRVVRYVAIVGAICAFAVLACYAIGLHGPLPLPLDRNGVPLGRDFVNTWFYGRAFFDADPSRFYDRALYIRTVHAIFPNDHVDPLWSYPPPFLILAAPLGHLAYPQALAAWTVAGLVGLGAAVRARGSIWLVAAVLTSPAVVFAMVAGQVSLFVAAVILVVLWQLDRRPVLAGLILSLLVIKPQAALLFPVLLIASRRWTVLLSATAGTTAIIATSVAVTGLAPWMSFFKIGLAEQVAEMRATIDILAPISVTITTAALRAGLSPSVASWLQLAAAGLAVALVAYVGWLRRPGVESSEREGQILLVCSTFASPYLLLHDIVPLTAVTLVAAYRGGPLKNRFALLAVLYAPITQSALCSARVCILPLCAIGLAFWLTARFAKSARRTGDEIATPSGATWVPAQTSTCQASTA